MWKLNSIELNSTELNSTEGCKEGLWPAIGWYWQ